jgi:hypothetical protein
MRPAYRYPLLVIWLITGTAWIQSMEPHPDLANGLYLSLGILSGWLFSPHR